MQVPEKHKPGRIRDAILETLREARAPMTAQDIHSSVTTKLGSTPPSSVRSYLRLNTPELFLREEWGTYRMKGSSFRQRAFSALDNIPSFSHGKATLFRADCLDWLDLQPDHSIHAVVTDPPYGLHEYSDEQQRKLRNNDGGVWRIPPSFDGHKRAPLPRFTTLTESQLQELEDFFSVWAKALLPKLVPGANVLVACNPLLSYIVAQSLSKAGLERRGEIIRLVMTMRGGDRPKAAHEEFSHVSVMPRSMWEPWLVYRSPLEGRVQDNLRKWKAGGFRRPSADRPFGDVIRSSPTQKNERKIAPHPSLKPQSFMRQIVRAVLPLGEGRVLDPFAGGGSTLAAAEAVGYESIGVERDPHFFSVAKRAIPSLASIRV